MIKVNNNNSDKSGLVLDVNFSRRGFFRTIGDSKSEDIQMITDLSHLENRQTVSLTDQCF